MPERSLDVPRRLGAVVALLCALTAAGGGLPPTSSADAGASPVASGSAGVAAEASPATEEPSPSAPEAVSAPTPSTSPPPASLTIADARAMPDETRVTVEGSALTGSGFHDGGGFVVDSTGGVAVIVDGGSFDAGAHIRVSGTIDDRFAQRTIRAEAAEIETLGAAPPVAAIPASTGSVDERLEGVLVRISGVVRGAPSVLSAGLAFDVDDGSGGIRVVVWSATGVDTSAWSAGAVVELIGVVGQRDSSGSGTSGYRVSPRASGDVIRVTAEPSASTSPSASPSPSATPTPSDMPRAAVSIREARALPVDTPATTRGIVTMPTGIVDETAVIADADAAIVVRLSPEIGTLERGSLVEVDGIRSTKAGMETLRLTAAPRPLGAAAEPRPIAAEAADMGEALEARLVVVTGVLAQSARRAASGSVTFDLQDGTGPVRVALPASLQADDGALVAGATVEVVGIVGQETTTAAPAAGYRIWPRSAGDVRLLSSPTPDAGVAEPEPEVLDEPDPDVTGEGGSAQSGGGLEEVGTIGLADLRIGATLVTAAWPELGIGGLLWDGGHLVAISIASVGALEPVASRRPPMAVELTGLRATGIEPVTGAPLVALAEKPGAVALGSGDPAAPRTALPAPGEAAAWVTVVGRITVTDDGLALPMGEVAVSLELRCSDPPPLPDGVVSVTGIGLGDPARLLVPCDGFRPAPTLARTIRGAPPWTAEPPDRAAGGASVALPGSDPRRGVAAGLLAAGVAALILAVAAWRRLGGVPESVPATEEEEGTVPPPEVPQLTLVRLRRERGS